MLLPPELAFLIFAIVFNIWVYSHFRERKPPKFKIRMQDIWDYTFLYDELKGKVKEIHKIGDCLAPRRVINAIYEAYKVAMELWQGVEKVPAGGIFLKARRLMWWFSIPG